MNCQLCNIEIEGRSNKKYCSNACKCKAHYRANPSKFYNYVKKGRDFKGEKNSNWKGGRTVKKDYVYLRKDGKDVLEHRAVMESELGRKLKSSEIVHHIDRNRFNNNSNNLHLFGSHREHKIYHHRVLGK